MGELMTSTDCERFGHEWEQGRCIDCGLRTHLAVPAKEMLLDDPEVCPFFGALTFDGLAVTPTDDIYLIVRTGPVRVYFGPDRYGVARGGSVMMAAMRTWQSPPSPEAFPAIMLWLASCWQITQSEISSAEGDASAALDSLPAHMAEWPAPTEPSPVSP